MFSGQNLGTWNAKHEKPDFVLRPYFFQKATPWGPHFTTFLEIQQNVRWDICVDCLARLAISHALIWFLEHCYLNVFYIYIYFLITLSLCPCLLSFSIRFKPYLSFTCLKSFLLNWHQILWLFLFVDCFIVCRGSSKKILFSVCFVFFDPPSDQERLLLSYFWETRRLSCFYDHPFTIWPDWLARINPVHYNQTFKPDS